MCDWSSWEDLATKETKYEGDEGEEQSSVAGEGASRCRRNLEKGQKEFRQSNEGKTQKERVFNRRNTNYDFNVAVGGKRSWLSVPHY